MDTNKPHMVTSQEMYEGCGEVIMAYARIIDSDTFKRLLVKVGMRHYRVITFLNGRSADQTVLYEGPEMDSAVEAYNDAG